VGGKRKEKGGGNLSSTRTNYGLRKKQYHKKKKSASKKPFATTKGQKPPAPEGGVKIGRGSILTPIKSVNRRRRKKTDEERRNGPAVKQHLPFLINDKKRGRVKRIKANP